MPPLDCRREFWTRVNIIKTVIFYSVISILFPFIIIFHVFHNIIYYYYLMRIIISQYRF